ncbi:PD-(D/E)XK nuclease family protein [Parapedobacter lycopersici]|uniref:PD-(D/E)XK nuclease family protein n=1 Tax=Parapedobacter lycopersici TaxID=1864939 RepID=UPI0033422E7E
MTPFLKQVAEDLLHRFGDDLKDIAVVLPNKRPAVFLRKYLAGLHGRPLWSPQFFTVQEFFAQSTTASQASPLTQFFALHCLHNQLLREEGRPEETPDEFYPLAETILSDFAQLDYELVPPVEIYAELRDIALLQQRFPHLSAEQQRFMQQFWDSFSAGKQTAVQQQFLQLWGRLPQLYLRFNAELANRQLITTAGIYRALAEGTAPAGDFIRDYRKAVFVGFNALNKCEATLFTRWQEQEQALFYFDADAYYVDDPLQEAGMFLRRNIVQYGLRNALGDFPAELGSRDEPIDIVAASGSIAQAKWLSTQLQNDPAPNASPSRTAIILADEGLLIPVLQSLPDGTPFNITMGYPLMQSPLFGLIDLWLTIQQYLDGNHGRYVHHLDVVAVLAHPLTGVAPTERQQLQQAIHENEWLDVPVAALRLKTGGFAEFFAPQEGGAAVLLALHRLLEGLLQQRQDNGTLRHLEASLMLATKKALNLLQEGLADYTELSVSFLCLLVRKALQSVSAPIEGEPLNGIQIMGLLESRCLDFDEVYLIGANEGTLPKITLGNTFIPDSIRRAHGLPVLENQDALSAYLFYRLLHTPQRITFVYNQVVDDRSSGELSRFVRQLAFESRFSFRPAMHQQPIKAMPAPPMLRIAKTGAVWKKLLKYLDASDPGRLRLSATAFTTYVQSPLLFFLKYVADIKEPPKMAEEFEMNRLGTVVHGAMQHIYEDLRDRENRIDAESIRRKLTEVPAICLAALSEATYGSPGKITAPNSMQRILLKIAVEYTTLFLLHDASEVAPFRIIELENGQDYTLDIPITVNGGAYTVRLYGIIDRVDEVAGKIRIVDYKTGRDEVKFHSEETLFAPASEKSNKALLQTLFYTYIYEQVTGRTGIEPHLYVARRLRREGSLFYRSGRGRITMQDEFLERLKDGFSGFLRETLEELFNPEIPFANNPQAPLFDGDPYGEFIGRAAALEDE